MKGENGGSGISSQNGIEFEEQMTELERLQNKIEELEKCRREHEELIFSARDSQSRYQMIFDNANDGIILHDLDGNLIDINRTMYLRLGYTKEEIMGLKLHQLVIPEFGDKIKERTYQLEKKGVAIFESADLRKDGTRIPVEVSARVVDYMGKKIIQSVVRDISERKLAEDLIWATKEETKILLEELRERSRFQAWLCDRVKHLIEEAKEKDQDLTILESHVERVKAMAFIEDKVFRSPSFSRLEMIPFLRALISYLTDLHRLGTRPVFLESDIEDLSFDLNRALRVSYLSFELITNAVRHAFPDGEEGTITLTLSKEDGYFCLTVRDNGIGVQDSGKILQEGKLGGVVIQELVSRLKGQSTFNGNKGTVWEIRFP